MKIWLVIAAVFGTFVTSMIMRVDKKDVRQFNVINEDVSSLKQDLQNKVLHLIHVLGEKPEIGIDVDKFIHFSNQFESRLKDINTYIAEKQAEGFLSRRETRLLLAQMADLKSILMYLKEGLNNLVRHQKLRALVSLKEVLRQNFL